MRSQLDLSSSKREEKVRCLYNVSMIKLENTVWRRSNELKISWGAYHKQRSYVRLKSPFEKCRDYLPVQEHNLESLTQIWLSTRSTLASAKNADPVPLRIIEASPVIGILLHIMP